MNAVNQPFLENKFTYFTIMQMSNIVLFFLMYAWSRNKFEIVKSPANSCDIHFFLASEITEAM